MSTIRCPYSHIEVYDSLYSEMPTSTKEQICALLASTSSSIQLDFINVQVQPNVNDCGLFSLAFSTALCAGQYIYFIVIISLSRIYLRTGRDPHNLNFDSTKMRPHLLECLEKGEIQPFPCKQVQRMERIKRRDKISIFCKCRTQEGGEMLECCSCTEWFHEECLKARKL